MRNKIILSLFFLFAFSTLFAQKNVTKLVSATDAETIITLNVEDYNLANVTTQNGEAAILSAPESSWLLQKDAPDLSKFTASIIIPDNAQMQVEVMSSKFIEIDEEINIAPSKGNLTRDIDPATVPYVYGKVYQENEFFPGNLTDLNTPYIVRDYRGQAVNFYPFQYNPVTKKLRIYTEITVKVSPTGNTGTNVFNRTKSLETVNREFNEIYKHQFLNYDLAKYDPILEEGNMLVICHEDWTAEMQVFVDWKNTIGRPCEMVTVSDAGGSASAIGTYVENYYNDNGLAYLLLVGDASQVPTNSGGGLGGHSDNAYAYILGNDHYLDFFVGRFSAESAAHVETQVSRTITYENGSELADGWLNVTMGVTSNQGPGDDNEYDYTHYRNMATDLLAFTYDESLELFDGSQGGNDASGNPTATMVGNEINSGLGIINYTGHGSTTAWVSSGYSVSNINTLTNDKMLPFIWSVACVNGNFVGGTCFGEAWLRATNGAEPTGAIAIMASTINQSWDPPMAGQDEMVDILVESYNDNIKRTYAGLSINGCHLMNDEYSDFAMTDTWTCFGDPSLLVRTDDPADMNITHNATVLFGTETFTVNCDYNDALACISKDGEIIGTDIVEGGVAEVPIDGLNPGDVVTIAVVGFNKVTYLENLSVISPSGPYVVVDGYEINGEITIDYGQTENIDITLCNVGPEEATDVTASLTSSDSYIASLTNNTEVDFGNIAGDNGTAISSDSYTLRVASNVPDQYTIPFDFVINSANKSSWDGQISIIVNAPVPQVAFNGINDEDGGLTYTSTPVTQVDEGGEYNYDISTILNGGNGDGKLDPGETVAITVDAGNNGHASFTNVTCTLESTSEWVTVNTSEVYIGTIEVDEQLPAIFSITVDEDFPTGTAVDLTFTLVGGEYSEVVELNLPVGIQIEDFETGDFTAFDWTSSNMEIQTTDVHEGTFAAHSTTAGQINSEAVLEIDINVTDDGSVSFYKKVSCENGGSNDWDYLEFLIDGQRQEKWDGEVAWSLSEFDISSGQHTLTWKYVKDEMVHTGTDCAWIDFITFPGFSAKNKSKDVVFTATYPEWLVFTDYGDGTANLNGTAPNENGIHEVLIEAESNGNTIPHEFDITVGQVLVNSHVGTIQFYPNPTTSLLNIAIPSITENAQLIITDISGKIVEQITINNQNTTIDFTNKAKGIYMLKLTIGSEIINQKIVVE